MFTNYPVDGCYLFDEDDFLELPPGLIVIDEAHGSFPARGSMRLPASFLMGLSQTRHKGWDLVYTAQVPARVDSVLRDVSNWWHQCNAFGPKGAPWFYTVSCWEPEKYGRKGQEQTRSIRRFRQHVADAYDTHHMIAAAAHTKTKNDMYAKGAR